MHINTVSGILDRRSVFYLDSMSAKKHLVILETLSTIAGGQRVLIDLMPALAQQFDVTVIVPDEGPLADTLDTFHIQVLCVPMGDYTLVRKMGHDLITFATEIPRLTWALVQIVRQHKIQLIYANSSRTFIWGTLGAWLTGRPIIWSAHNLIADRKTRTLINYFAGWKNVRRIVCPSEDAATQFAKHATKITVIPNRIDLNHFMPSAQTRIQKRIELGISLEAPVVGIIGDLIPLKRQDMVVTASTQVAIRLPNAVFLIVGGTRPTIESRQYQIELEKMVQQSHSDIRLLGFRTDIAPLLNALDVLVVASTMETGPLVLLQALASGVPVVSTFVGMAPWLLGDGTCGALFAMGDSDALAKQIIELLPRAPKLGTAARQRAIEWLDLKESQAQILSLIEDQFRPHANRN